MNLTKWAVKKSPWIYHVATGSCNNCDIEVLDCLTPKFDVERFGIKLVGSPRHADALMVTGALTKKVRPRFENLYQQTAKPCLIVAVGTCSSGGGIFNEAYNCIGPIRKLMKNIDPQTPVVNIPGCPPKPEAIISGVVKALESL